MKNIYVKNIIQGYGLIKNPQPLTYMNNQGRAYVANQK